MRNRIFVKLYGFHTHTAKISPLSPGTDKIKQLKNQIRLQYIEILTKRTDNFVLFTLARLRRRKTRTSEPIKAEKRKSAVIEAALNK